MPLLVAQFPPGKWWATYLREIEMIECDTEYPPVGEDRWAADIDDDLAQTVVRRSGGLVTILGAASLDASGWPTLDPRDQPADTLPTTPEGWCAHFKALDREHHTNPRSPFHHDKRCDLH